MDIISITEWENDKEYNDNVMIRTLRHQLEQKETALDEAIDAIINLKVRPLGNTDLYVIDRAEFAALKEKYKVEA